MSSLLYMYLNDNSLVRTLPSSLGNMQKLQDLSVAGNRLGGAIPKSFGNLQALSFLQLQYNIFTGQLPTELGSLVGLRVLQLHGNSLSGDMSSFLWQPSKMTLVNVDFSNNRFSGRLSDAIFQVSTLNTVALSVNCLEGDLGDIPSVCNNKSLISVLSMDGLGAAGDCKHMSRLPFSQVKLSMGTGVGGTIPRCLLSLPNLEVLHLSANEIGGDIEAREISPKLLNLSLSHNHIGGSIPSSIKEHLFTRLDLSYNKISGNCEDFVSRNDGSDNGRSRSTILRVNRISGGISRGLQDGHRIDILQV